MTESQRVYAARIELVLTRLGVAGSFGVSSGLPLHQEAADLVSVGPDIYGREQFLVAEAAERWQVLERTASREGVTLQLVSAFRTVDYQRAIFERKIAAGSPLEDILRVNAPPGYSEHHTGRAVDVTTPGAEVLSEAFELTEAFTWLTRSSDRFRLRLSYPRGNEFGMIYEPWHWFFLEPPASG